MHSWLINIPIDLRNYFQRGVDIDFYLSIKKMVHLNIKYDFAVFWGGKYTDCPGIMGYGLIITNPIKPGDIPKENRIIYDSSNYQIGVKAIYINFEHAIIPENFAYKLPSFGGRNQAIKKVKKSIYWGHNLYTELHYFTNKYRYLINSSPYGEYNENHFNYVIHRIREHFFMRSKYKIYKNKLNNTDLICSFCKIDFAKQLGWRLALRVMELHEVIDLFSTNYIKIVPENFKMICPTCHKIEHDKIMQGI